MLSIRMAPPVGRSDCKHSCCFPNDARMVQAMSKAKGPPCAAGCRQRQSELGNAGHQPALWRLREDVEPTGRRVTFLSTSERWR